MKKNVVRSIILAVCCIMQSAFVSCSSNKCNERACAGVRIDDKVAIQIDSVSSNDDTLVRIVGGFYNPCSIDVEGYISWGNGGFTAQSTTIISDSTGRFQFLLEDVPDTLHALYLRHDFVIDVSNFNKGMTYILSICMDGLKILP